MGTSDIVLERVQALLKVDTGNGSLHEHLIKLSRKLAEEKPGEALNQLEALSRHLKKSNFRGQGAPDQTVPIVADAPAEESRLQWCDQVLKLVRPPSDPTASAKVLGAVQNFMEDAAMFRWAGVGFEKQESYHIACSLRKLASDTPSIESLRLWGKVLGSDGDYYVAEGVLESIPKVPPADGEEKPPIMPDSPEFDVEQRGEGANTFTYWVSSGGCAPWVRLPAARASHIVASRKMKKLLTGDLNSQVLSMPWFPGKERHFLRAQIARISATCTLAPEGWYEKDEEAAIPGTIKEAAGAVEALAGLGAEGLGDQPGASWVHRMSPLNKIGKCSYPDVDTLMEAETTPESSKPALKVIAAQKEAEGGELDKEILSSIEGDLGDKKEGDESGMITAWSFKVFGDKGVYKIADAEKAHHQVMAARSNIWPGAVAVAQGTKFANIYIGYATKCSTLLPPKPDSGLPLLDNTAPFSAGGESPLVPDDIMDEPEDLEEKDEPNPGEDDVASLGESVDPAEEED